MTRRTVGVDVTAHKEERNVTDTKKKTKLRVRYYVELVVGSPRENHTRLGFSGSFQALMRLHREFVQLYVEKYGESHGGGLITGRESFLSSSSSTSRSSVSSTSRGSPTSLSNFVRHTFGLKKKKSAGEETTATQETTSNQFTHHSHHHHHQHFASAQELPGIAPFPVQNKMLVHLESGEAKDDAKIEARNAALFEYYSHLFNSDDGEMYLELITQHAQEKTDKNKREASENQTGDEQAPPLRSSTGLRKLLGRPSKSEDIASNKHVEFFEPVYVRARGKSRVRRTTRGKTVEQAP